MSFSFGNFALGGPSSPARFAVGQTRGRIQGGGQLQGVNYPSPFFDVAHTYLPTTIKQLFKFCRYYFLTNPLINAVVMKMSEYPVTDIVVDHEDPQVVSKWTDYLHDTVRVRSFQVECGLDYNCYGTCPVSLSFPFQKYLTCRNCGFSEQAKKIRDKWLYTSNEFRLTCPKCGHVGAASPKDWYYRDASSIRPVRWNVEDIEVSYNDITGESTYFYTIPAPLRADITLGKKDVVESMPQIFLQAIRQQKGVVFSKSNFFALKRATIAWQDRGWGIPMILPVLKDAFYLQIMKKAQEAILLEHIVPLRVIFPQAASGTSDPYCISPETLVETIGGLLPACEVRKGDYLRSHTGAWRRVEALKRRSVPNSEKVYRFKVASLPAFPFEVSEDHPILATRRVGGRKHPRQGLVDPDFIPAQELRVGDYVAYPTKRAIRTGQVLDLAEHNPDRAATDSWVYRRLSQGAAEVYEWLEDNGDPKHGWGERKVLLDERGWSDQDYATAYAMRCEGTVDRMTRFIPMNAGIAALIGYYLAEGSKKGSLVSFSLNLNEKHLADEIEFVVKAMGFRGVSHHERPDQHGRSVDVQDVLLSGLLMSLCGTGFANKRVPDVVAEGTDDVVLSMLSRLFIGDGCDFKTSTNRVGLKLSNPSVVLEARRLLLSFGVIGGVSREEPTKTSLHKTTAYQLSYNGSSADRVRQLFSQAHPYGSVFSRCGIFRGDYVLLRIDEIEEVDVPEVIGFQMHGDRSFCVAGVATHNTTINLQDWRDQMAAEIARWRHDHNYIPIMPLPIGNQSIGGDGKALLLSGEMMQLGEQIIMGMGVPREFLQGGLSYSGTNVSMRMLENAFLSYIGRQRQMVNWMMGMVAHFMGWPKVNIRFKPFKMADDLQRKSYLFQLNQAQKISDTTLLSDADLEIEEENDIMMRESARRLEATKKSQLAMAEIQGESQVVMMKMQAKAQQAMQQAMQQPPAPGEPGVLHPPAEVVGQGGGAPMVGGPGDPPRLPPAGGGEMAPSVPNGAGSQLSAEQDMGAEQGQEQMPADIIQLAEGYAMQILQLPQDQQEMALQAIEMQSPDLFGLVIEFMQLISQGQAGQATMPGGAKGGPETGGVDQRPLPEVLPPRREAAFV